MVSFCLKMNSTINTHHSQSVSLHLPGHRFIYSNLPPYFIKHHLNSLVASLLKLLLSYFSLFILFLSF